MKTETKPFRFVAGARCPVCGSLDALQVRPTEHGLERRCVQCGILETLKHEPDADQVPLIWSDKPVGGSE